MERNDKCFCGSGKKYKKCHYYINGDSLLAKMYKYRNMYDIEAKKYCKSKCYEGCHRCCNNWFYIYENEFLIILDYLLHNDYDLNEIIGKSLMIKNEISKKHPELISIISEKREATIEKNFDYASDKYFNDDFGNFLDMPYCVFLNDGKCDIYNVRPDICRYFGTTAKCDYLKNDIISIPEIEDNAMLSMCMEINGRGVIRRPYPLFYWFSDIMTDNKKHDRFIFMSKEIAEKSEDDYKKNYITYLK